MKSLKKILKKFVCWSKIEEDTPTYWIQLFNNPGLNHIGKKILLEVDDIEDILSCRLVTKDFQSLVDNPQFWFMKMQRHQFLSSADMVPWKFLLELIKSNELMLEYNISHLMMKMYRIREVWKYVFRGRLNICLLDLRNVLPAKQAKELGYKYCSIRASSYYHYEAIPSDLMGILKKMAFWQTWKNPLKNAAMFGDHQLMKLMLDIGMEKFLIQGEDEADGPGVRLWIPLFSVKCVRPDPKIQFCDVDCNLRDIFRSMVPHQVVFDRYTKECDHLSWTLLELAGLYHHWDVAKLLAPYVPIDRLNIHPNYRNVRYVTEKGYANYQAYLQDSCLDKTLIASICGFYRMSMQAEFIFPQN